MIVGLHVAGLEIRVAYASVEELDQTLNQVRDKRRGQHVRDRKHLSNVGVEFYGRSIDQRS